MTKSQNTVGTAFLKQLQHLDTDGADLPLGCLIAPHGEYVPPLSQIGGYDDLAAHSIGQDESGIFVGDPSS